MVCQTWQQNDLMKKSQLKALIQEVMDEVSSFRSIDANILNIQTEIRDMAIKAMNQYGEVSNISDLKQALINYAKTPQQHPPLDVFYSLSSDDEKKQFLKYLNLFSAKK